MELTDAILIVVVGTVAGFINVLAGGGSLITLPLLIFMGLSTPVANATNRVAIFSQNIFAVAGFRSKGISTYPYSLYVAISALFGAIIGAKISVDLHEDLFNKIIAVIMVLVIAMTLFRPKRRTEVKDERTDRKSTLRGMFIFFFIGIYGGFIQAGVGFLMIAALTGVNRLGLVKTNSVKVFVTLIYTAAALIVFMIEDVIDWRYGLTLAAGNSLGAWIASRWSVKKGDQLIKPFLAIMVVILAIKLWFF